MRAKILLLSDGADERLLAAAERALTDAATAFGHTFILTRDRLAAGAPDPLVNACLAADAVLVDDARSAGLDALNEALGSALRVRALDAPREVRADTARVWVAAAQSVDDETLSIAFDLSKKLAAREELSVSSVAPGGKTREDWLSRARAAFPDARALTAPDAAAALIEAPRTLGLLLAPPSVGAILLASAAALAPDPVFLRDLCLGGDVALFAPMRPKTADCGPWGALQAAADLLRDGLSLTREADCVEAAVRNVLAAGWRTADIAAPGQPRVAAEMIGDLVSEQIELAGELLGKGVNYYENPSS